MKRVHYPPGADLAWLGEHRPLAEEHDTTVDLCAAGAPGKQERHRGPCGSSVPCRAHIHERSGLGHQPSPLHDLHLKRRAVGVDDPPSTTAFLDQARDVLPCGEIVGDNHQPIAHLQLLQRLERVAGRSWADVPPYIELFHYRIATHERSPPGSCANSHCRANAPPSGREGRTRVSSRPSLLFKRLGLSRSCARNPA